MWHTTSVPLKGLNLPHFHVDIPGDADARRFLDILDEFGLQQHVNFPTHKHGHTLDLLISRADSDTVSSVEFDYPCVSDHHAVLASFKIPGNLRPQTINKSCRQFNKINITQFRQDILDSESDIFL